MCAVGPAVPNTRGVAAPHTGVNKAVKQMQQCAHMLPPLHLPDGGDRTRRLADGGGQKLPDYIFQHIFESIPCSHNPEGGSSRALNEAQVQAVDKWIRDLGFSEDKDAKSQYNRFCKFYHNLRTLYPSANTHEDLMAMLGEEEYVHNRKPPLSYHNTLKDSRSLGLMYRLHTKVSYSSPDGLCDWRVFALDRLVQVTRDMTNRVCIAYAFCVLRACRAQAVATADPSTAYNCYNNPASIQYLLTNRRFTIRLLQLQPAFCTVQVLHQLPPSERMQVFTALVDRALSENIFNLPSGFFFRVIEVARDGPNYNTCPYDYFSGALDQDIFVRVLEICDNEEHFRKGLSDMKDDDAADVQFMKRVIPKCYWAYANTTGAAQNDEELLRITLATLARKWMSSQVRDAATARMFAHASDELRGDVDLARLAVTKETPSAYQRIEYPASNDKELLLRALEWNRDMVDRPLALQFASEDLRSDVETVMQFATCVNPARMLAYLQPPALTDNAVVDQIISPYEPIDEIVARTPDDFDPVDLLARWKRDGLGEYDGNAPAVILLIAFFNKELQTLAVMRVWMEKVPWLLSCVPHNAQRPPEDWFPVIHKAVLATHGHALAFAPPWYKTWLMDQVPEDSTWSGRLVPQSARAASTIPARSNCESHRCLAPLASLGLERGDPVGVDVVPFGHVEL